MTACENDHSSIQRSIWNELEKAISNRHHGWLTPVLATIDQTGLPDARTVVLSIQAPSSPLYHQGHKRARLENNQLTWLTP
ncbi:hypothetical protein [Nitrincola sp.]|uniref:hypothetical protein n=1 Tax=Nitrincola sp. TaxID=1926584 RepID=UPI003A8F2288